MDTQRRSSIDRRRFVAAVAAAPGIAPFVRGGARAAEFTFKAGTDIPNDFPMNARMIQMWGAIEQESRGRIHVDYFPNSQLGTSDALLSQLRLGGIDFANAFAAVLGTAVPAAEIGGLGFTYRDDDEALRVLGGGPLAEYLHNEIAAKGIYGFRNMWTAGMYAVTASSRPVRTPDDLKGMKIRVTPNKIVSDLFKELGATPTSVAGAQMYTALQTKLVDGASLSLAAVSAMKLYEVQKYLSLTNHQWAGCWLLVNADTWKRLPRDLQTIVERNNNKYASLSTSDTKAVTQTSIVKLGQQGLVVNKVDDQAPFVAQLGSYFKEWSNAFGPTEWGMLQNGLRRRLI